MNFVIHLRDCCGNVNIYLSFLQGLGLFAARDLDQHTMVIEYIGELIRNEVANRREKIYEETVSDVLMVLHS